MTLHVPTFLERVKAAKARIRQVSPHEARALIRAGALVIDIRDEEEFGRGHIEGAIQVDGETIERRIAEVAPDQSAPIVCYCSRGYRAALAADALQRLGYRSVASIDGGLRAYLDELEGNPSNRDDTAPSARTAGTTSSTR